MNSDEIDDIVDSPRASNQMVVMGQEKIMLNKSSRKMLIGDSMDENIGDGDRKNFVHKMDRPKNNMSQVIEENSKNNSNNLEIVEKEEEKRGNSKNKKKPNFKSLFDQNVFNGNAVKFLGKLRRKKRLGTRAKETSAYVKSIEIQTIFGIDFMNAKYFFRNMAKHKQSIQEAKEYDYYNRLFDIWVFTYLSSSEAADLHNLEKKINSDETGILGIEAQNRRKFEDSLGHNDDSDSEDYSDEIPLEVMDLQPYDIKSYYHTLSSHNTEDKDKEKEKEKDL